jgi:hypothetical protein
VKGTSFHIASEFCQPNSTSRLTEEDGQKPCSRRPAGASERPFSFVREATEIVVHIKNAPASISKAAVAATTPNVEILASCLYWQSDGAVMRLVSEDPPKTAEALARAGFECQTHSVLLMGLNEIPGACARTTLLLAADGIAVSYWYVSWSDSHEGLAVFKTTDDNRALRFLEVDALMEELAGRKSWRALRGRRAGQASLPLPIAANRPSNGC